MRLVLFDDCRVDYVFVLKRRPRRLKLDLDLTTVLVFDPWVVHTRGLIQKLYGRNSPLG